MCVCVRKTFCILPRLPSPPLGTCLAHSEDWESEVPPQEENLGQKQLQLKLWGGGAGS